MIYKQVKYCTIYNIISTCRYLTILVSRFSIKILYNFRGGSIIFIFLSGWVILLQFSSMGVGTTFSEKLLKVLPCSQINTDRSLKQNISCYYFNFGTCTIQAMQKDLSPTMFCLLCCMDWYSSSVICSSLCIRTHSLRIRTHSLRIRTVVKFYNHTLQVRR